MMKCFFFRSCHIGTSFSLNKHAVDMLNELLFSLGNFGKICLPHPYTSASLIFLGHWRFLQKFARRGRIRKSSNFDPILVKQTEFTLVQPMPWIASDHCNIYLEDHCAHYLLAYKVSHLHYAVEMYWWDLFQKFEVLFRNQL